MKTNQWNNPSS